MQSILSLIGIYSLANFLLLLNRGIYWDSWNWLTIIKGGNYGKLWGILSNGQLYLNYFLMRMAGESGQSIYLVKTAAFASWIIAGICLYLILKNEILVPEKRAFFLTAYFLTVPTFLVKIETSVLNYSILNAIFFLAALIYFQAQKIKNSALALTTYAVSWLLFFMSFLANSFLVFFGGFLLASLFLYFKKYQKTFNNKQLIANWIKNNLLFIIAPIIFWIIKSATKTAEGPFTDYNEFIFFKENFLSLLTVNSWNGVIYGFFWPLTAPLAILQRKIFAAIFFFSAAIIYFLTKKSATETKLENDFSAKTYFVWGLIFFSFGLLPYVLVGKGPHIFGYGFGMRNALLLPLGSGLIILGSLMAIAKEKWQAVIEIMLLSLFTTFTIFNYFWQDMDWYKQQGIIANLRETADTQIKNASTIIFHDKLPGLNWQNRNIGLGDYLGYVREAFPDMKFAAPAGIDAKEGFSQNILNQYLAYKKSGIFPKNFQPDKKTADVLITTDSAKELFTVSKWLKLKKYEIFYPKEIFLNQIKEELQIETRLLK